MPVAIERARQEGREGRAETLQAEYKLMLKVERAELA